MVSKAIVISTKNKKYLVVFRTISVCGGSRIQTSKQRKKLKATQSNHWFCNCVIVSHPTIIKTSTVNLSQHTESISKKHMNSEKVCSQFVLTGSTATI